ncbi:MAG: Crp/Fnr family transcriptional regulator [Saprospiraceae bacterium]|nr:Crp/Fnr family transcriptional regulator [Saprospiraceae bacterium]
MFFCEAVATLFFPNKKYQTLYEMMIETVTHPPQISYSRKPQTETPMDAIVQYISEFRSLTDAEIKGIRDNLKLRTFEKGTLLLREGQVSSLCYFILKGCVRQYYLVDGVERTTNFYTEGQPVTPYEGTFKKQPSKFYLSCVEDSTMSYGTPEDEAEMFAKFPQFELICRLATEEELGKSQNQLASFMLSSPEERYLDLLKTRPDLLDRVPQYQLASYIGVTPESLSRIRKRIMAGKRHGVFS